MSEATPKAVKTGEWFYEFSTYAFSHGSGFCITEHGTPGGMAYVPKDREKYAALIVKAVNSHEALVAACKAALARIESDIESDRMEVPEGDQLRAALTQAGVEL